MMNGQREECGHEHQPAADKAAALIAKREGRHVSMGFLLAIKWSLIAFAVALVLDFLSMGVLGAALYYACYPLLAPFYGNPSNWDGDWVWPAIILAGMLWSVSFLAAGWLNLNLTPHASALLRGIVYVVVLWLSAVLIWVFILVTSYEPSAAERQAEMTRCGELNRSYVEAGLSGAFGALPKLLDGPRCLKTPYGSDMIAAVQLAPGFTSAGMTFSPGSEPTEAPLDMLETIYPEPFKWVARTEFEVASTSSGMNRKVAAHLIRLRDGKLYVLLNDVM